MKSLFTQNARLPELQALEQRLNAAPDIADKGERLLELEDIRIQNEDLIRSFNRLPEILLTAGMFCGVVALLALNPASLSAIPVLIGATAIGGGASLLAALRTGKESMALATSIGKGTNTGIEGILSDGDPLAMAVSPRFKAVMAAFPELKEKFILASAKKTAEPQSATPIGVMRPLKLEKSVTRKKLNL